jgi:hypothetical protein
MKSKPVLAIFLLLMALTFAIATLRVSAQTRDVAITSVTPSVNKAYVGWVVAINVTVKNNGEDSDQFEVTAFFGNETGNYTIDTMLTPLLPSGESITLTFSWDTAGVQPCQNYTIKANCTLPEDPTQGDNEFVDDKVKINMFADINGDGKIDIKDVVLLTKAFGTYPGLPRWNPDADLNNDGKISIIDLVHVMKNFGKTCL